MAAIVAPSLGRAAAEMLGISALLGQPHVTKKILNVALAGALKVPFTLDPDGGPSDRYHYERHVSIDWDSISRADLCAQSLMLHPQHIQKIRCDIERRFARHPVRPVTALIFVNKQPACIGPATIINILALRPTQSEDGQTIPRDFDSSPYYADRESALREARDVWERKALAPGALDA